MKLDRETLGRNKYALIKNRKLDELMASDMADKTKAEMQNALVLLKELGVLDVGDSPATEFFVMRLKDRFAAPALSMYSQHAAAVDLEYAKAVGDLAKRAGMSHPLCKNPD